MMTRTEVLIKHLDLRLHPEGGYFKETYRSQGVIVKDILSSEFKSARNFSTSIYLLTSDSCRAS